MPPERTLTDADVQAITLAMQASHTNYMCGLTPADVSAIKDILTLMRETRSNMLKGVLALLVSGFFVIVVLGLKTWVKQ
jgi:hypothetical protein